MKLNHRSIPFVLLISFTLIALPALPAQAASAGGKNLPSLEKFAGSVNTKQTGVVTGVYVPGVLALKVMQQPANDPAYVSTRAGSATQFQAAAANGVTGLLAHNYLAGAEFLNLAEGQDVWLVYGDGALKRYRISRLARFQALESKNPYSPLVDLATGVKASAAQVFGQVYAGGDQVVFQTCISKNGDPSWGRLFVVAAPVK